MLTTLKRATEEALRAIEEEMRVRGTREVFLLFAMGSQFDHLIAQQMRKLGVFCLVADPASVTVEDILKVKPTGIILSGGPASVHSEPPPFDCRIFDAGIPVLGICLGFQLWAKHLGIPVIPAEKREFSVHRLRILSTSVLFEGIETIEVPVLESHGDRVEVGLDDDKCNILADTANAPAAAAQAGHLWGVQFHPEVTETIHGMQMFENFVFRICRAKDRFPAEDVAARKVQELGDRIGPNKRVLLALSGGSDSSSTAGLLGKAVNYRPCQIRAVYIRGVDRPDDEAFVRKYFGNLPWLDLRFVDATEDFLAALRGKESMREKRVAVREVYKIVLEQQARLFEADFIAQGTLYTDISESGGGYDGGARKAQIKLHHNVNLGFSLPELTPFDDCVKDGARSIGKAIGVSEELLQRHPFPGPGLVVRIEGEVNAASLAIARAADDIYIEELRRWKLYESVWQAGAVVTKSVTTCTKGDDAVNGLVIAIWAVWSVNGFTAQFAELPYDFLREVSRRMTNEIREVGAVVLRISDKPPATIDWG